MTLKDDIKSGASSIRTIALHKIDDLNAILEDVCETNKPTVIKRKTGKAVVLMSIAEYRSWMETIYLSTGANGERLRESIAQLNH